MNKEFKKINSKNETRYILETASVGGTSAGDIGSAISNLETIQRRLQELKKSVTVPKKPPRNPVNMGSNLGRGTQKHIRSNRKKEKDSKKIFELNDNANNGSNLFVKFRLSELPNEETRIIMFGGYGNKPKDVKRQDSIFTPITIDYRDIDNSLMKIKSTISNLDSEENEKIFIDIPSYLDDILTDIKDRITSELIDDNKNIELYRKPGIDNGLKKDDEEDSLHYLMTHPKGQKLSNIDPEDNTVNKNKEKDLPLSSENNLIIPTNVDGNRFIKQLVSDGILNSNDIKLLGNTLYISKENFEIVKKELKQRNLKDVDIHKYFPVKKVMRENKELDHEISMARNELKSIITDAQKIMSKLKKYSEEEGIMAWQQSKITKSADFMNSVNQSLDENNSANFKKKVEEISEDLRKWFKEKWVRFGPDGKIRGACARGSKAEGKPKCLPQSKAHALGKKGRASAASRKRREDPNPERKGSAINVKTKESRQGVTEVNSTKKISFKLTKGRNKFSTIMMIDGVEAGVYKYDANSGRSLAEVFPEFKGQGFGKILVLNAIYTATQLGLNFQEDDSRTAEYDNVLDSLSNSGYIVDDDGYLYITDEGVKYLEQTLNQQEMTEGNNSSSFNQEQNLRSKSNKELADLIQFWNRALEKNPENKNAREQLGLIKMIRAERIGKKGVAEGKVINTYLWHGSRQKISMLEPRQAVDTGGAAGSNQNAIYATSDPKVAIAMGLTTPGSDTGMFPNDPQMVLFSGKIRKGEYVYLHKLPFKGPDGKPQFVQGGNSREFHSIPGVEGIKPIEIKEIPVNKYLNLIRKATPADLKLRKKYMKKQSVAEGQSTCPHCGGPIFPESVINEKKDACYYKVKSRYKVWPSAYACVPEETSKALTRDGWKSVDELSIGEEIMTYNMKKDIMEFKPILNLHRYNNVITNVVKSGNTGFMFECTPNHKWVVKLPEQNSDRVSKYDKINGMILLETNQMLDVKNNKHLVVTAPYEDGKYIKKDKIFKYGDNWIKYILEISPEQRQSWLFSAIVYDGDQRKTERITENKKGINDLDWEYSGNHGKQSFGFKQKDIMHRDAFLLAAFLNGGTVTWKKYTNRDIYSCHFVNNKRYKNLWNFKNTKENLKNVWCPETENNTWVMMQETNGNGIITITGNSGALVKCRKKGSKNWGSKKENMQNNNKKLSEQESQNDELELQKIKEKNLKFIKKLINPDTVGAGNSLSDSQKSAMMDNASKQPEMQKNPLDLVKFALDIGYSPEDVLDSIPLGLDLSKDLPKS